MNQQQQGEGARVVAVCISPGGIPKRPVDSARVGPEGLEGDGHAHEKHIRPHRAVTIFDLEILRELVEEGYPLEPGTAGENITAEGLFVQRMRPGMRLKIGDVLLKLEEPRRPCYVLDAIDPKLKEVIVNRCGYLASVLQTGTIRPDMPIECLADEPADRGHDWPRSP